MADKALDLVFSYDSGSKDPAIDRMQKALDEGYRVVDVFATAVTPGGAANAHGHVVVTVVLTKNVADMAYRRKSPKE